MKLKLKPSASVIIDWKGSEYELRKPAVKETADYGVAYSKADKENAAEVLELTINHLERLGLPKEVSYEMEMDHITQISNAVNKVDTSGK